MMDLRLPIGAFFIINAILLIGVGVFDAHPVPFQGRDINLDLVWGAVMLLFGMFMTALSLGEKLTRKNREI